MRLLQSDRRINRFGISDGRYEVKNEKRQREKPAAVLIKETVFLLFFYLGNMATTMFVDHYQGI